MGIDLLTFPIYNIVIVCLFLHPGARFAQGKFKKKQTLRLQVCPKKGISPTFLFFSDGIGALKIPFDREGSLGSLGKYK